MGTGYTRNDTGNNISDGNVINAADLDGEFDAIVTAFGNSSGHDHDGTAANGAPITKFGPSQEVEGDATALFPAGDGVTDLGKSTKEWKDLYIDGVINTDDMSADTATMVSATITNNASVGGTFNVGGATTLTGAASLSNTLAVSADSAFKGAVSVESTLRVTGDTDVEDLSASGTFDVAGTTNLATAIITGTVNIVGETTLDDVSASGTLDVAGETNLATATITGTVNVTGDTTLDNVTASGTLNVAGTTNLATAAITGTLAVSGNASVGGTLKVDDDITNTSGNLTVDPATQIFEIKGSGSTEGQVQLNCAVNTHGQKITAADHAVSATNTLTLPGGSTIGNADATLVSDTGTQTLTNKTLTSPTINGATIDSAVSVSSAGTLNAGTNADIQGTLNVAGSAGLAGNVNLGNATADSVVVGGVLTANASANLTGNVGVGGTITGGSTVSDQDGDLRDIPVSTKVSGDYTLAIGDVGNQVTVNSANVVITVPSATFTVGDIISIISVNGCTATLACTAINAVKAGDLEATALHTLDANGVASILFSYTADLAVLTGNVSGVE